MLFPGTTSALPEETNRISGRRCGMITAMSIIRLIALVLTLILTLRLILSFHEKDEVVELDYHNGGRKRYLF